MSKNRFIRVPDVGHVLISGPLFDWLTKQQSNKVTLSWSPVQRDDSMLTTLPLQHLHWKLVSFFDEAKQSKEAWLLEPNGELPNQEILKYIEETFG